jgi:hypothetical protein
MSNEEMDMAKPNWQVMTVLPNGTEISTVELPQYSYFNSASSPYETCVFEKNGPSNVVGQYETKEEAIKAHVFLVGHELMHEILENKG